MTVSSKILLPFVLLAAGSSMQAFGYDQLQEIDHNPSYLTAQVQAAIHALGVGINTGHFGQVRQGYIASSILGKEASEEQFARAFKSFIDNKIDLTRLDGVQPKLNGTGQVGPHNELVLTGHYPTQPQLNFKITFIREGGHLGLTGIDLDTPEAQPVSPQSAAGPSLTASGRPPVSLNGPEDMPDAAVMAALQTGGPVKPGSSLPADQQAAMKAALQAFVVGVESKDMSKFLSQDIVSPLWRRAQTAEQLARSYHTTIDGGADIGKFERGQIIVPNQPIETAMGELRISGVSVASDGDRLGFRMGFDREAGQLKLIGLVVVRSRDVRKP